MNTDIVSYYRNRAKEYEKVYTKPERQSELLLVEQFLHDVFRDKNVLEIACGTGYWTQKISGIARSILATDINETVIEMASSKEYPAGNVEFKIIDLFKLNESNKQENLFGGFIWSHIKLQELPEFIEKTTRLVVRGGTVAFIDNNYVEGSSQALTDTDAFGNTYQTRKLEDGSSYKVLKNFPNKQFIQQTVGNKVSDVDFVNLRYYWLMKYKIN